MIRWFARNHVAANFLMLAILFGGVWSYLKRVPLEVQPSIEFKQVRIDIEYRGASPADVERAVVIPVEQAMEGLSGVKSIESDARAGMASIEINVRDAVDPREVLDEVTQRVQRITSFPQETEAPQIYVPDSAAWFDVIKVAVCGELDARLAIDSDA